ncbi:sulfite exporter TauE/SafE family protein [Motiliproteus sp.]|uniref:sulfite exporter TauE/SafE family protein n=1 Tax=Motiliproteus sp. TaxID=1898955 RepID=UPI003BABE535
MLSIEPQLLSIILATFLLAGLVKGVTGLGLPTVCLAILTLVLDLPSAMALLLVPSLLTNLQQAFSGGAFRLLLTRLWPFLLAAVAMVGLGAKALVSVELSLLSALLGAVLVCYGLLSLAGFKLQILPGRERVSGIGLGLVNGLLTGMTGSFVVPGVLYLQAIGLPRDQLVQSMGMLFSVSTLALGLSLGGQQLLSPELGLLSLIGVLPAVAGMWLGQQLRRRMSETLFRRALFIVLMLLGGYLMLGSLS